MNKLFLLLIFLLIIPLASASTVLNNTVSNNEEYIPLIIDTEYRVNISDVFKEIYLEYSVSTYPKKIIYSFYNTNNESVILINTISKENIFPIGFKIIKTYTAYYNLNQLNLSGSFILGSIPKKYNITDTFILGFDFYKSSDTVKIDDSKIYVGSQNFNYNSHNLFLPNRFTLPISDNFLNYTKLRITYQDKTEVIQTYIIDSKFDSLNFVFKFIFLGGKAFIGVANFAGIISNSDYLNFQLAVLFPLEILNFILNTILFTIGFIWNNLLLSLGLIILITFIYDVIITHDIYEAIPKFANDTIFILTLIIVNPIKWIFEKIVKFWS